MADHTNWTISWNDRERQFFARYRRFDGKGWGTKRLPKTIMRRQRLDADRFMIAWYAEHMRTGGAHVDPSKIDPVAKTLRLLGSRWLKYRFDDAGTKPNTYRGFDASLTNWILDNDRFDHASVESLDMEHDFNAETCLGWMASLKGGDSTRLVHILTLKTIFADCVAMGWLDADLVNPFDRPAVHRVIASLAAARKERVKTHLAEDQIAALLTIPTSKVHDYRRIRYLLALSTGLRDHEMQGLVMADLHLDVTIPFVGVERQLDKIGCKPFVRYGDLVRQGLDKVTAFEVPNAIVSDPKRRSFRDLPLLPIVVEAMRWWKATGWKLYVGRTPESDDPVFPSGMGNRHSPPGQFCFVESAELLRADLTRVQQPTKHKGIDLDFHALRRTFATMLSSRGIGDGEIGDLLGHGAKSVARGHYIDELLGRRMQIVLRLPLPNRVQLRAGAIEVETEGGEVIPMRKAAVRGTG